MTEFTTAAGVQLHWAEAGSGAPLLFVHGIPTDLRAWGAQQAAFASHYRTIAYSRRFAWPSVRVGDVLESTISANSADLGELIDGLSLGKPHLVGHSYGGFIAAQFASEHPERLRSLTLVEPAIASLLLQDPNDGFGKLALLLRSPPTALSANRFLNRSNRPAQAAVLAGNGDAAVAFNVDGVEDRAGAVATFAPEVQSMMRQNWRTIREADTRYPPLGRAELGRIRVPTLVVHGETGVLWLRRVAAMTARHIPGSTLRQIDGAGHYPHVQRPTEFNRALGDFLQRHDSGP